MSALSRSSPKVLVTPRLVLREWKDTDLEPFAQMNGDPRVMEFMIRPLTRAESDAMVDRICQHFSEHGYGLWAVELAETSSFVGFAGLSVPSFEAHFTPCVEIGWRLGFGHWGNGYATEAARCVLDYAFSSLSLDEVVSFTARDNRRSRAVMERLGMAHDPLDDFEHPMVPENHPVRSHVLYRVHSQKVGFIE
jgi:RimJ/RimL family protein N-acetyltransferase